MLLLVDSAVWVRDRIESKRRKFRGLRKFHIDSIPLELPLPISNAPSNCFCMEFDLK